MCSDQALHRLRQHFAAALLHTPQHCILTRLLYLCSVRSHQVEQAQATSSKIEAELKDLKSTLKNIEDARPFDQLTVDDVVAARPEIGRTVDEMVKKGKWTTPGYDEKFGSEYLLCRDAIRSCGPSAPGHCCILRSHANCIVAIFSLTCLLLSFPASLVVSRPFGYLSLRSGSLLVIQLVTVFRLEDTRSHNRIRKQIKGACCVCA